MNNREKLQIIFDTLEGVLGDTEPFIDEDMTDDEIREEEPIFWCAKEIMGLLKNEKRTKTTTREAVEYPENYENWTNLMKSCFMDGVKYQQKIIDDLQLKLAIKDDMITALNLTIDELADN